MPPVRSSFETARSTDARSGDLFAVLPGIIMCLLSICAFADPDPEKATLQNDLHPEDVEARGYLEYARTALDHLMEHGTDRYGDRTSDHLLVSVLNLRTRRSTRATMEDEPLRVNRPARRNPAAVDLLHDQDLIRTMDLVSDMTGDRSYRRFATRYIDEAVTHLTASSDPSFWWGWHRRYDVIDDRKKGHKGAHHELHATDHVHWNRLYSVKPVTTLREVNHIWKRHVVDKQTGEINRHDTGTAGRSFIMTAGAFIEAFAAMYNRTGADKWLERARLVSDYNWNRRSDAGLLVDTPNAPDRWDGKRVCTTLPGLYARSLLRAARYTDSNLFARRAETYLTTWHRHAYDPETGRFRGSLTPDGTPVEGPRVSDGTYAQYEPRGYVDLWQPYVLGYEHPLAAARSYAIVFADTGASEAGTVARKWARLIRNRFPPADVRDHTWYSGYAATWAQHGTYAKHYGQVLLFFLDLYRATERSRHLEMAERIANEAVSKLWYNGNFRGHPAKPTYEAVDGVGLLMKALTKLARTRM